MMTGRNIKKSSIKNTQSLLQGHKSNQCNYIHSSIYLPIFGTQLISHYFDSYTALDTFEQCISFFFIESLNLGSIAMQQRLEYRT